MVDWITPTEKPVATAIASAPKTTNKCNLTYMVVLSKVVPPYSHDEVTWRVVGVKNGFSDPTKVQEGRDWPRKDIMNRCQGKALSEGCHERKKARTVVSSREKINNNKNLARVTTKSKSEMQTVSNGCVGRGA